MVTDGVIKIGRNVHSRAFLVGDGQPLRIVTPFGTSGPKDLAADQAAHIDALARAGTDAVHELSTFGHYADLRPQLVKSSAVPYGTVLAYEVTDRCLKDRKLTPDRLEYHVERVLETQIEHGIDYTTVHASLSTDLLERTAAARAQRAIPIPSRSAGMLLTVMARAKSDNPLHATFPRIAKMCAQAGVVISLGTSLRCAAIADALDDAMKAELQDQGIFTRIAHEAGAQVMLEGLSHGVPADLEAYVRLARESCAGTPITALGPLPVDIAAGADHIAAAIGLVFGRLAGLSLVNVVSAREHVAMPTQADMIDAIRAARIAAYVADVIKEGRHSPRDRAMSVARATLNWTAQRDHAMFKDLFEEVVEQQHLHDNMPCSICGQKCPFLVADLAAELGPKSS